jgi:autotransporter adhesin
MNKKVVVTGLAISTLAVNVMAADNNFIGGTENTVTNNAKSVGVVGYQNTVGGNNAVAFGENNVASGTNSFVGGNDSKATGRNSFAYGSHAEALTEYTYAIGSQAKTSAYDTIAIGNGAYVSGVSSVAIGRTNNLSGENSVVIGANNKKIKGNQSTVIGYNNKMAGDMEQTIIGANSETSGQGTMAIGTHAKSLATDAVALGNNTLADNSNSVALGTNSVTDSAVGVDGITINGTRHIFAGEQPASVVSFGSRERAGAGGVKHYNRQLQNVSAGRIEVDSLDAVNGSQLFAAIDEIETNAKAINNNKTAIIKTQNNLKDLAVGVQMLGDIVQDNATSISNNTKAITDLGKQVNTNTADIKALNHYATNHEGRVTQLEKDTKTIKSDVANTQKQVNVNTKDIADLKDKVGASATAVKNELNNRINQTDKRLNNLGASSAALAGLHPLDFNKNDKASYAVSYGHYRSSNAIALGAFYRPNERTMFGLGMSLGAEKQFTANVAFKVGKGSDYLAEAKGENARINQLEKLVEALTKEVSELKGK